MEIFLILTLIVILFSVFKLNKRSKVSSSKKMSIIDWMKMSNEDRNSLDISDRIKSMQRKKKLLKNIRNEYKKIVYKKNI